MCMLFLASWFERRTSVESSGEAEIMKIKRIEKVVDKWNCLWYSFKVVAETTTKKNKKVVDNEDCLWYSIKVVAKQQQWTLITKQWKTLKDSKRIIQV